jgi:PXPV repeat (3 copies)
MKIAAAVLVLALLLIPGVALAGSDDAALALGAFAVFNQIISGTGIFAGAAPVVVAPRPVYVAPQPVYVAPQPVYVAPQPVYVAPRPVVVYRSYPQYHRAGHGHWKHDWKHDGRYDRGPRGHRH